MGAIEPVVLARLQFAANVTFHILFPTISIALGWFLLFFKNRFVATGEQRRMDALRIKGCASALMVSMVKRLTTSRVLQ